MVPVSYTHLDVYKKQVTHILLLNEVQGQRAWEATGGFFAFTVVSRNHAAEVVGNHAVLGGGVFEGFDGKVKASFQSQGAFIGIYLFNNGVVVAALPHDCDCLLYTSSTFGGRNKVAIGACMQESAILAFPSHSMLSKR